MSETVAKAKEIKTDYVEKLVEKINCFVHSWTAWKRETVFEGEGWERVVRTISRRHCNECGLYQEGK